LVLVVQSAPKVLTLCSVLLPVRVADWVAAELLVLVVLVAVDSVTVLAVLAQ
jgi:hypothetical protein